MIVGATVSMFSLITSAKRHCIYEICDILRPGQVWQCFLEIKKFKSLVLLNNCVEFTKIWHKTSCIPFLILNWILPSLSYIGLWQLGKLGCCWVHSRMIFLANIAHCIPFYFATFVIGWIKGELKCKTIFKGVKYIDKTVVFP